MSRRRSAAGRTRHYLHYDAAATLRPTRGLPLKSAPSPAKTASESSLLFFSTQLPPIENHPKSSFKADPSHSPSIQRLLQPDNQTPSYKTPPTLQHPPHRRFIRTQLHIAPASPTSPPSTLAITTTTDPITHNADLRQDHHRQE